MRFSKLPCLLTAILLVGCLPNPGAAPRGTTGVKPNTVSPKPSSSASLNPDGTPVTSNSPSPSPSASAPAPVLPRTLEGMVKLPSLLAAKVPIISDNGANLIGNNGGSLIGKTKFRTLANEPVLLAGVAVRLVDAAGKPVKDAAGKELIAVTDAQGRYGFEAALPTDNLLVEVVLADGAGAARAIAPPAAQRTVDVDLASTLATNYILSQYVKTQTDPVATLNKLPAAVEAETRAKTQTALAGGQTAVPEALTDEKVVATVNELRQKNTAFNDQLETVKKLLIAAGQSDLGNGQLATDVLLGSIHQVVPAADGSVYLSTGVTHLFQTVAWRVNPQGRMERLTAPGEPTGSLAGKKASEARFGGIRRMAVDDLNRLWILQGQSPGHAEQQLVRIETDGTLKDMAPGLTNLKNFIPTAGGGFFAFCQAKYGDPVDMYEGKNGQAPTKLRTLTGTDAEMAGGANAVARDAQGRLYFCGYTSISVIPKVYRLDNPTGAMTLLRAGGQNGVGSVGMDAYGNVFTSTSDQSIKMLAPSGAESTVAGVTGYMGVNDLTAAPGGGHYMIGGQDDASLYLLKNGNKTLYAGKEGQSGTSTPGAVTGLKEPRGMAVAPDGTVYVTDDGTLLRFKPGGTGEVIVPKDRFKSGEHQLVPWNLRTDAQGRIYVLANSDSFTGPKAGVLYRLKADDTLEVLYETTDSLHDVWPMPNGEIYLSVMKFSMYESLTWVLKRKSDGTLETILPAEHNFMAQLKLGFDAEGNLLFRGGRKVGDAYVQYRVWKHKPGAEPELLPETTFWPEVYDANGRAYAGYLATGLESGLNTVRRYSPATGNTEVLAGTGGKFFNGTGVDDSVDWPQNLTFDSQGNLYFLDRKHKQVKRLPAESL